MDMVLAWRHWVNSVRHKISTRVALWKLKKNYAGSYKALSLSNSCSASLSPEPWLADLLLLLISPLANERSVLVVSRVVSPTPPPTPEAAVMRARRCDFLLRAGRVGVSAWLSSKLISRTMSGLCPWKMFCRERDLASCALLSAETRKLDIRIFTQWSYTTIFWNSKELILITFTVPHLKSFPLFTAIYCEIS